MRLTVLLLALALCSAQTWQTLAKDLETIMIGISFVNSTHGWVPGDDNGTGAKFIKTNDGGLTWTTVPHDGYVTLPMGIAMQALPDGTVNGVIGGIGFGRNFSSMEYTPDGFIFHAPPNYNNLFGESQDAKVINGLKGAFGLAGQYTDSKGKNYNGLTASYDGGKTFYNIDTGITDILARYAHFPSANVWYVAFGNFPSSVEATNDGYYAWTSKVHLDKSQKRARLSAEARYGHVDEGGQRALLQTAGYAAAIAKTTDGGKTWSTVYSDYGNYYFNDIDCPTETDCWAVGESGSDSPAPGVRILHTANGGLTWDYQLQVNDSSYSLMDIYMLNTTAGWAVGAIFGRSITGIFYYTADGGNTWTLVQQINDEYPTTLSFVQPTGSSVPLGWATAFTREGLSSILGYK